MALTPRQAAFLERIRSAPEAYPRARLVTYQNTRAPAGSTVLVRLHYPGGQVAPVIFTGDDLDAVRRKAQSFWETELAKELARREAAQRPKRAVSA